MTKGTVKSIIANLLTIEVDGPVGQNEICYIHVGKVKLRAEVIRIRGKLASAQVFESTRGIKIGNAVEFTGNMLEIELGPGILSRNYDGLQSDLDQLEGTFLQRGEYTYALNREVAYDFKPLAQEGDEVQAGDWLGNVKENWIEHKIMVPFNFEGIAKITQLAKVGKYKVTDVIAKLVDENGKETSVNMIQRWPVKKAIKAYKHKPRPYKLLQTGMRLIDTFNPMTEGGTGFIPGPFGTGKTVLQHAIAKNGEADIIIVTACGERANEVVEIFTEFPELTDPRTGRKLNERTTIICNTSNMPVAAREASVYVGMTISEYYRAMGLKVLILADSTSRWAQALREMSNRLEELPGPDAFPMDLSAIIANFYARAGMVELNNGQSGSVTFIGTVSPAGGNFKEPVTESTAKVARCFYALSQKRADSKRYPAIESSESYSKYLEYDEFRTYTDQHVQKGWTDLVNEMKDVILRGQESRDQINILGNDAVPLSYHTDFWKSEIADFILLQQDSFDEVDMNCPMERQKYMLNMVIEICRRDFEFEDFEESANYFKKIINLLKQMNYSVFQQDDFNKYESEVNALLAEKEPAIA
ncbi:MAG: V-type ATP synthase subunit A [Bacteroidota bacterium]